LATGWSAIGASVFAFRAKLAARIADLVMTDANRTVYNAEVILHRVPTVTRKAVSSSGAGSATCGANCAVGIIQICSTRTWLPAFRSIQVRIGDAA
jgi:hypothetical protein